MLQHRVGQSCPGQSQSGLCPNGNHVVQGLYKHLLMQALQLAPRIFRNSIPISLPLKLCSCERHSPLKDLRPARAAEEVDVIAAVVRLVAAHHAEPANRFSAQKAFEPEVYKAIPKKTLQP